MNKLTIVNIDKIEPIYNELFQEYGMLEILGTGKSEFSNKTDFEMISIKLLDSNSSCGHLLVINYGDFQYINFRVDYLTKNGVLVQAFFTDFMVKLCELGFVKMEGKNE